MCSNQIKDTTPAWKLQAPDKSLIDFDWRADALTRQALESRLDLKQARLIVETSSMAIRENLAGYLPTISAGASVSKSNDGVVDRDVPVDRWTEHALGPLLRRLSLGRRRASGG